MTRIICYVYHSEYSPEQKYFVDINHVTVTADSPDLSDSVTELAYSMLKKSFTPKRVLPLRRRIFLCIYQ